MSCTISMCIGPSTAASCIFCLRCKPLVGFGEPCQKKQTPLQGAKLKKFFIELGDFAPKDAIASHRSLKVVVNLNGKLVPVAIVQSINTVKWMENSVATQKTSRMQFLITLQNWSKDMSIPKFAECWMMLGRGSPLDSTWAIGVRFGGTSSSSRIPGAEVARNSLQFNFPHGTLELRHLGDEVRTNDFIKLHVVAIKMQSIQSARKVRGLHG